MESPEEDEKGYRIVLTEQALYQQIPHATHFRYPYVYGPYQMAPREWCIVKRIIDRRPAIILPDAGLTLQTFGYAENIAHALLLAADQPERANGQIYNCGDSICLSLRQVVDVIATALGHDWQVLSIPNELCPVGLPLLAQPQSTHRLLDLSKLRYELGYQDVVPPVEALARTARWLVDHPPKAGGMEESVMQDPFDYQAEDRIIAAWTTLQQQMPDSRIFATPPEVGMSYSGPGGRPRSQAGFDK